MSKTKQGKTIQRKKITFSLEASNANEVALMGDFNNWNPKKHPMKKKDNGIWNKTVTLAPGKYEYKFLIDGNWVKDPGNDEDCPNIFGTQNSVLNLTEP
jgi:1,4-alpha-glucan branching enzyme